MLFIHFQGRQETAATNMIVNLTKFVCCLTLRMMLLGGKFAQEENTNYLWGLCMVANHCSTVIQDLYMKGTTINAVVKMNRTDPNFW